LVVVITTAIPHRDMHRLCPGGQLRWGRCDFLLNPPRGTRCDYWIVFATSRDRDHMQCNPANTLFIAGEPPSKKIYPRAFYAQFARVVSTRSEDPHPRVTTSALGLNWHVGLHSGENRYVYGYDELRALTRGPASNKISVVCSDLTTTEGQRLRLRFLQSLKDALGDSIIHFGRGFTPITDKMDAILPYRFHLVLENSASPHYWTEKLADAYLGLAHPFYSGCPNLADYFPPEGFTAVDANRPDEAIALMRAKLAAPVSAAETAMTLHCRDLILDTYNPFARFAYWTEQFHQPGPLSQAVEITTHKAFRPFPRGLLYRLRRPADDPN
jgi:hypothetical protein